MQKCAIIGAVARFVTVRNPQLDTNGGSFMEICIIFCIVFLITVIMLAVVVWGKLSEERRLNNDSEYERKLERKRKTNNLVRFYLEKYNEYINLYNYIAGGEDKLLQELEEKAKQEANQYARLYNKNIEEFSSICNGVLPRDLPKSLPILIDANVNN